MTAVPEYIDDPVAEEDDAVRTLMSALLSGEHSERAWMDYVTSLCRARPEAADKMLALLERYRAADQLSPQQYRSCVERIERLKGQLRAEAARQQAAYAELAADGQPDDTQDLGLILAAAAKREARQLQGRRPLPANEPTLEPPPESEHIDIAGPEPLAPAAIAVGTRLADRYELQMPLGRGGRGQVYEALDTGRRLFGMEPQRVALKLVPLTATAAVRALGREFHDIEQLSHPNVVHVYSLDADERYAFYTMERLYGEALHTLLRRLGALPQPVALGVAREIGAALTHAHKRGVVHADLKPHNVLYGHEGDLRVLDFGGIGALERQPEPWIAELSADRAARPTSPAYASPQQLEGQAADSRDDIYALACLTYQLLSGQHPFDGRSSLEARTDRLRLVRPAGIGAGTWRALRLGLAFERERRPSTVEEWLEDLGALDVPALPPLRALSETKPSASWLPRILIGAVVIGALVFGGLYLQDSGLLSRFSSSAPTADATSDAAPTAAETPAATPPMPVVTPNRGALLEPPTVASPAPRVAASASVAPHPSVTAASTPRASAPVAAVASPAAANAEAATVTDTAPRAALNASDIEVAPGDPAARIVVHRIGSTSGDVHFSWWTQDGSAKSDTDYAASNRRDEVIPSGQPSVTLYVPIISSSLRHDPVQFDVVLTPAGASGPAQRTSVVIDGQ